MPKRKDEEEYENRERKLNAMYMMGDQEGII